MASYDNFNPKKYYLIAQVAHKVCKKEHHQILSETVSDDLSATYEMMQASSLVFVSEPGENIKSFYITKHACDIRCKEVESSSCILTYNLQSKDLNGFSITYNHDKKIKKGSKIILIIPHFDLYITGDLSFMLISLVCQSPAVIGVHGARFHVQNGNNQQSTMVRNEE
jgi:hypothetical protein